MSAQFNRIVAGVFMGLTLCLCPALAQAAELTLADAIERAAIEVVHDLRILPA